MESINLSKKTSMPIIGYGVYQIDPKDSQRVVTDALSVGYRLIDTAQAYGNESGVGAAIAQSGIKRDEIFITTKLWISHYNEGMAYRAFEQSLKNLKTDYIDLYLLHQPYGDIYGAYRALSKLKEQGVIREIGISNFHSDRVIDLFLNNEIKPALNQIEINPFYQREDECKFMRELGINVQSWASFAEGKNNIFKNEILNKIAQKYNKSVAQVILKWLVQRGIGVIPKTMSKDRMVENLNIFDFVLDSDDINLIKSLDRAKSMFFDHRDPAMVKMINSIKL